MTSKFDALVNSFLKEGGVAPQDVKWYKPWTYQHWTDALPGQASSYQTAGDVAGVVGDVAGFGALIASGVGIPAAIAAFAGKKGIKKGAIKAGEAAVKKLGSSATKQAQAQARKQAENAFKRQALKRDPGFLKMSPGDRNRALGTLKKQTLSVRGGLIAGELGAVGGKMAHDHQQNKELEAEIKKVLDASGGKAKPEIIDTRQHDLSPEEVAKMRSQRQTAPESEIPSNIASTIATQFKNLSPGVKAGVGAAGILGGVALAKKLATDKKKKNKKKEIEPEKINNYNEGI